MEITEISRLCVESSMRYYAYLNKHNKGVFEISIVSRELVSINSKSNTHKIRLILTTKLIELDYFLIKNSKSNLSFSSSDFKIISFDSTTNTLEIQSSSLNFINEIIRAQVSDLLVVSDFKFLVKRVENWYRANGNEISLPQNRSALFAEIKNWELDELRKGGFSIEQINAIKCVFSNAFSYVWGIPGSGKTQFVLSFAMLKYLQLDKKIVILAPTNNSIEQVLKPLIDCLQYYGERRDKIIRLGTPSKVFADNYPEVCEIQAYEKKYEVIQNTIHNLQKVINYKSNLESSLVINQVLRNLRVVEKLEREYIDLNRRLSGHRSSLAVFELEKKELISELGQSQNSLNKLKRKSNSLFENIKSIFSSNPTKVEKEIIIRMRNIEGIKSNLYTLTQKINQHLTEISSIEHRILSLSSTIQSEKKKVGDNILKDEIKLYVEGLTVQFTITDVIKRVSEFSRKIDSTIDEKLLQLYGDMDLKYLTNELNKFNIKLAELENHKTENRLKEANVIACTIDTYIYRYLEIDNNISHYFLDEAGYTNIIKALTLFKNNKPITFLGDHKQLPPVCEINDRLIENDPEYHDIFLWAQSSIHVESIFNFDLTNCCTNYLKGEDISQQSFMKISSLMTSYRFSKEITNVLSRFVYKKSALDSGNHKSSTQIFYINAPKIVNEGKRVSVNEVKVIKELLRRLKSNNKLDYVVLTPYKDQLSLLRKELPQEVINSKILTVHSSQGQEWEIVILSVVDTSNKFLVDSNTDVGIRVLNTAISRVKTILILVCDIDYWINQPEQMLSELLKQAKEIPLA